MSTESNTPDRDEDRPKTLLLLPGCDPTKTPPFSEEARVEAGTLLRRLQNHQLVGMPHSRPMPSIGPRCHELRVRDEAANWRLFYRIDPTVVFLIEILSKKTQRSPKEVIDRCKARLKRYDET